MVHSTPSWLVFAEIKSTMNVTLPKWFTYQFKPVQQRRQQVLRAYCPDINLYTVTFLVFKEFSRICPKGQLMSAVDTLKLLG